MGAVDLFSPEELGNSDLFLPGVDTLLPEDEVASIGHLLLEELDSFVAFFDATEIEANHLRLDEAMKHESNKIRVEEEEGETLGKGRMRR